MTNECMIASNNITLIEGENVITDEHGISQKAEAKNLIK